MTAANTENKKRNEIDDGGFLSVHSTDVAADIRQMRQLFHDKNTKTQHIKYKYRETHVN